MLFPGTIALKEIVIRMIVAQVVVGGRGGKGGTTGTETGIEIGETGEIGSGDRGTGHRSITEMVDHLRRSVPEVTETPAASTVEERKGNNYSYVVGNSHGCCREV